MAINQNRVNAMKTYLQNKPQPTASSGRVSAMKEYLEKKQQQPAPESNPVNTPAPEKPGFLKSAAQGVANPFIKIGKGVGALGRALSSKIETNPQKKAELEQQARQLAYGTTDAGFFGQVKPSDYSFKDAVGTGLEVGSFAIGGGGAKTTLQTGLKGFVKQGVKQGAKTGLAAGATAGAGTALQQPSSTPASVLTSALQGGALGALGGGVFGGASGLLGRAIGGKPKEQLVSEALDIVRPVLNKADEAAAVAQGRGSIQGFAKKVVIAPSKTDTEIANAAAGIVKSSNNHFQNIKALQDTINKSTSKIREGLKQSNAIWNKNLLKSKLNTIELPVTVKSDKTLTNQAQNFSKAILQKAETANKKTEGLLDLRQDFDALVKAEFPNLYDKEMTPTRLYISKLREALNSFAESQLPDGKLPTGESFRSELRKQHLLIKAIENISEKAPREGTTGAGRFLQRHPTVKRILPYVAGGAIGGTAISGLQ